MKIEIKVPHSLGDGVSKAKVTEWLKAEGEAVESDEPLLVIETEKTSIEIGAAAAGHIVARRVSVGDLVDPGQLVAVLETP